jgi:hypothetical protein
MLALLKRYRLVISEVALALGAATRLNVWVRTNHVNMGEGWLWTGGRTEAQRTTSSGTCSNGIGEYRCIVAFHYAARRAALS